MGVESSTYCRRGFFCLLEMNQKGGSLTAEEKVSLHSWSSLFLYVGFSFDLASQSIQGFCLTEELPAGRQRWGLKFAGRGGCYGCFSLQNWTHMALGFDPVMVADLVSDRVSGAAGMHVGVQSCTSFLDRLEEVSLQILCAVKKYWFLTIGATVRGKPLSLFLPIEILSLAYREPPTCVRYRGSFPCSLGSVLQPQYSHI